MRQSFTINLSEITQAITSEELLDWVKDEIDEVIDNIHIDLVASPPTGTPVDTGEARQSIQTDKSDPLRPELYSTADHMPRLNDGWSKQTPAGYWERAVDKHTD